MTTSLLRNLLRTSSVSRPSDEPSSPSLKASPSFSDFSCGVQAETEDTTAAPEPKSVACSPGTPCSIDRRSFDSLQSQSSIGSFLSRRSLDARGLLWGNKTDAGGEMESALKSSPSMPIPNNNAHAHAKHSRPLPASAELTPRQKARKQKIDGLEFYEWAELIRSSSL